MNIILDDLYGYEIREKTTEDNIEYYDFESIDGVEYTIEVNYIENVIFLFKSTSYEDICEVNFKGKSLNWEEIIDYLEKKDIYITD